MWVRSWVLDSMHMRQYDLSESAFRKLNWCHKVVTALADCCSAGVMQTMYICVCGFIVYTVTFLTNISECSMHNNNIAAHVHHRFVAHIIVSWTMQLDRSLQRCMCWWCNTSSAVEKGPFHVTSYSLLMHACSPSQAKVDIVSAGAVTSNHVSIITAVMQSFRNACSSAFTTEVQHS